MCLRCSMRHRVGQLLCVCLFGCELCLYPPPGPFLESPARTSLCAHKACTRKHASTCAPAHARRAHRHIMPFAQTCMHEQRHVHHARTHTCRRSSSARISSSDLSVGVSSSTSASCPQNLAQSLAFRPVASTIGSQACFQNCRTALCTPCRDESTHTRTHT